MQHHPHAARSMPQHLRGHHMAPPAPPPHMVAMNLAHPPPPPQQNPLSQHHMNNGPATVAIAPATAAMPQPQQPPHMRDHHNRLPHQQQQQQHQAQQLHMQKLRHQNVNNNINKGNYLQQQQHTKYNIANAVLPQTAAPQLQQQQAPIASAVQQQQVRSATHHQQQQQQHHHRQQQQQPLATAHLPHMKNHVQQQPQQHMTVNASNSRQQKHQQAQIPMTLQQQQQQPQYYGGTAGGGNKAKYNNNVSRNNNNNNNYNNNINVVTSAPKTILQNPNRTIKTRLPGATAATSSNNIEINTTAKVKNSDGKTSNTLNKNNKNNNSNNITIKPTDTEKANESSSKGNVNDAKPTSTTSPNNGNTTAPVPVGSDAEDSKEDADKENHFDSMDSNEMKVLPNTDHSQDEAPTGKREKTPMCLVNELARFNKITHQYRLTCEKGPPHCKRFTVTLKLGDEEFTAEGFKIKKAQHLAASEALEKTVYKHPTPRPNRREEGISPRHITPTVELNAVAMKLAQEAQYIFEPRIGEAGMSLDNKMVPYGNAPTAAAAALGARMLPSPHMAARMMDMPMYMRRGGNMPHGAFLPGLTPPPPPPHPRYNQPKACGFPPRFNQRFPMMPPLPPGPHPNSLLPMNGPMHPYGFNSGSPCRVTLIVGEQKWVGLGRTIQQAKHDAAARALIVLRAELDKREVVKNKQEEAQIKSPISMVHEIGIHRNINVHFKVLREEGPAHMRTFITACIADSFMTEGQGNTKRLSKKHAAEKMLKELLKLPPLSPVSNKSPTKLSPVRRTKGKSSSRAINAVTDSPQTPQSSSKAGDNSSSGEARVDKRKRNTETAKEAPPDTENVDNPITRLIQLQQARKEKEPVFEVIARNGNDPSRRREFIIEVTCQGMVARGTGTSKKLAKREAAENLLNALTGSESTTACVSASKTKETAAPTTAASSKGNALTSAIESSALSTAIVTPESMPIVSTSAGPVPGIVINRQNKKPVQKKKDNANNNNNKNTPAREKSIESTKSKSPTPPPLKPTVEVLVEESTAATKTTKSEETSSSRNISDNRLEKAEVDIVDTPSSSKSSSNQQSNNTTGSISSKSSSGSIASILLKDQLLYLAKLIGFEVSFSDYPKGNHNEFLTIVTLSTDPPQICHGVGASSEESQNDAAKNALKILSELGLNNAKK